VLRAERNSLAAPTSVFCLTVANFPTERAHLVHSSCHCFPLQRRASAILSLAARSISVSLDRQFRTALRTAVNYKYTLIHATGLQRSRTSRPCRCNNCFHNIVTYTRCGSVSDKTSRVRIGYRIYSLWRLQLQQITITENILTLVLVTP
jgi:hypothetical protein